jgi:galactose mutarotase-like enzyme
VEVGVTNGLVVLDDGVLRAAVSPHGAELRSFRRHGLDAELLWQGDPTFWERCSPLLFPIVGALRDGAYSRGGSSYRLGQHGFARDCDFTIEAHGANHATFALVDDEATRACYPFAFRLEIAYHLTGSRLTITYRVTAPPDAELLFSIGAHPGFACPVNAEERLDDYLVELEAEETASRWPVVGGLIADHSEPCLEGSRTIPLREGLFDRGALVFKDLRSRRASLLSRQTGHGIELAFSGFPYFALWSRPGAPFVCLEPWCGIADTVSAAGRLEDKEGIVRLAPTPIFERELTIRPF